MKEELLILITKWLSEHRNPYDNHTNEKVYWNMIDLLNLIKQEDKEEVINIYYKMFNRFKYYY